MINSFYWLPRGVMISTTDMSFYSQVIKNPKHGDSICFNALQPYGFILRVCARNADVCVVCALAIPTVIKWGNGISLRVALSWNNLTRNINPVSAWLPGKSILEKASYGPIHSSAPISGFAQRWSSKKKILNILLKVKHTPKETITEEMCSGWWRQEAHWYFFYHFVYPKA